jgi:hypothetical protein
MLSKFLPVRLAASATWCGNSRSSAAPDISPLRLPIVCSLLHNLFDSTFSFHNTKVNKTQVAALTVALQLH